MLCSCTFCVSGLISPAAAFHENVLYQMQLIAEPGACTGKSNSAPDHHILTSKQDVYICVHQCPQYKSCQIERLAMAETVLQPVKA